MQGTLPVLNAEVVRKGVLAGLALNAQVSLHSKFDRKQVGLARWPLLLLLPLRCCRRQLLLSLQQESWL